MEATINGAFHERLIPEIYSAGKAAGDLLNAGRRIGASARGLVQSFPLLASARRLPSAIGVQNGRDDQTPAKRVSTTRPLPRQGIKTGMFGVPCANCSFLS